MMLTYEEMEMVIMDMLRGDELRVSGSDVDEFKEQFQADIDLAKENNWSIEIPFDIEDINDLGDGKKRKIIVVKGGPGSGHFGHAGRPGKVGGSASGRGRVAGTAPSEPTTLLTTLDDGNANIRDLMDSQLPGGKHWVDASYDERGDVKSMIVQDLSERTGIPEEDVNKVIGQWARSSNDGNLAALELQETAAEVLGVEMGEWQKARLEEARQFEDKDIFWFDSKVANAKADFDELERQWDEGKIPYQFEPGDLGYVYLEKRAEAFKVLGQVKEERMHFRAGLYDSSVLNKDGRKTFIQEMYNWTQDELSNMGLGPDDPVTLARGINRDYMDHKVGDVLDYHGNAIESWSISRSVAADFATSKQSGTGMIIAITVPRKNIISTAVTGMGALIEGEVIISGTTLGHKVRVYDIWQLDEVFDD